LHDFFSSEMASGEASYLLVLVWQPIEYEIQLTFEAYRACSLDVFPHHLQVFQVSHLVTEHGNITSGYICESEAHVML
jgi:hypothetical protein